MTLIALNIELVLLIIIELVVLGCILYNEYLVRQRALETAWKNCLTHARPLCKSCFEKEVKK